MSHRPKFLKPSEGPLYPERVPEREGGALADEDARSSFVYNRYHHLPHDAQRQKLPIFQYRNHILYLLERYQTLVLVGETGCGKSTQVPQYLLEVGHRVCVTEPRVAAAAALAARVAAERGERVGERVGYAAGMTAERSPDTGLVFVTEGALLREMFASPLLMQYSCVIIDEVHERTQLTDVLMGLLKKIIKKRKSLKLVVSSATLDAEFLRDFFNVKEAGRRGSATVLAVPGRPHALDLFYVEEPVADYVKATVETVIKIHENEPFGDVLAFLTSQEEIRSAQESLESYASSNRAGGAGGAGGRYAGGVRWADVSVLPLYGSLPHYQQLRVFQTAGPRVRKVILSTNIAETSVTIPGVSYVIDCGFHKLPYFSPSVGVESVCVTPVSKNNALQRAGRAGRTAPGKCYRLYTESAYGALAPSVPPEMSRSELSAALLQLKALGIHNLLKFSFPTPPPAKCILSGLELLYALQAIDKLGAMTPRGANMAELPLRPMLARILCGSDEWGCIDEALSVVSMLQVEGVFSGSGAAARVSRRNNFEVAEGDIIMYLNIMDAFLRRRKSRDEKRARRESREWCGRVGLDHRAMEKAYEIRTSLEKLVRHKFGMTDRQFDGPDLGSARLSRVMRCVCAGLFPQAGRLVAAAAAGAYRGARGATLYMSSDSCLYTTQLPDWVVFASVSSAGERTCMRDVMRVRREWLLELAPHYYTEE